MGILHSEKFFDNQWLKSFVGYDYYPFGMGMPGREFSAGSSYRYGFNGKENDNEVRGEGNQQDYGMRMYDTRLGKFLSVDPLATHYPNLTPFQFASNSPIAFIDQDGLEAAEPKKVTGIAHISVAYAPGGMMEDAGIKLGIYNLYLVSGTAGPYYVARYNITEGPLKGMYRDDWIIGVDALDQFRKKATAFSNVAIYIDAFSNGKVSSGLGDAYISCWTPTNVIFGVAGALGGMVALGETSAARATLRNTATASETNNAVEESASNIVESERPSWQQSEQDALENGGYREQVSFKNGKEVPNLTKGSVRPEGYKIGETLEVKNYKVRTEKGRLDLINNVVKQVRTRIANLPKGTFQKIVIDARGQMFKTNLEACKTAMEIRRRISSQAGSANVNIVVKLKN